MEGTIPCAAAAAPLRGFDFTAHIRRLCVDLTRRLPELAHVDMDRVAIRVCQTRRGVLHGIQASLTPLRFQGGARIAVRGAHRVTVEPLFDDRGRELLYLVSFYLPRFLNHPFREKLCTILHELWHISPDFDGDLRRHAGRCYAHGPSAREFHGRMDSLARCWLNQQPPPQLFAFLHCDFHRLAADHGGVFGLRIPTPKLLRCPA